jgi:hypothetical protein
VNYVYSLAGRDFHTNARKERPLASVGGNAIDGLQKRMPKGPVPGRKVGRTVDAVTPLTIMVVVTGLERQLVQT